MSENSSIEWTDHTWSPVWGCTQVSPACDHCYAQALARRFGTGWNGAPMREFGEHHWNEPVRWNRKAHAAGARPRVFPSMCDPFDKDWPAGVRERFWRLIDATPHLTWLLLTKRIGNVRALGPDVMLGRWPANVWIGSTVVNQEEADRDIPKLLALPARVRFLSIEPMLGPVDVFSSMTGELLHTSGDEFNPGAIHWIIAGGESGPKARPAHPNWFRSLRDQCAAAGVPFLFKQWGEWSEPGLSFPDGRPDLIAPDDDARFKVGKKAAGRQLDGRTHDGMPEA